MTILRSRVKENTTDSFRILTSLADSDVIKTDGRWTKKESFVSRLSSDDTRSPWHWRCHFIEQKWQIWNPLIASSGSHQYQVISMSLQFPVLNVYIMKSFVFRKRIAYLTVTIQWSCFTSLCVQSAYEYMLKRVHLEE